MEIDLDELSTYTDSDVQSALQTTVSHLRSLGKTGVFLKVSMPNARLMAPAWSLGFKIHRAEGETSMLLLWLGDGECKVPPFGTHVCGVAGVLLDADDKNILLVKEKISLVGWKLPGGYVNLGEDFSAAAVREVFEVK